jgi:hypothetical protein
MSDCRLQTLKLIRPLLIGLLMNMIPGYKAPDYLTLLWLFESWHHHPDAC